jgi:GTPase SAR1 family protein
MILGQTGVGKSTLINYLYGSKVVDVGTGRPVTGKNDFNRVTVPSNNSETDICIFDSWGLESDKAEDWKKVINAKLSSTLSFDDMVYGIVYCMSYSNDRIQDFEITMLKELLSKGYKIVIVFTNADNGGYATKKVIFRDTLAKKLPEYQQKYSVVDICSQAKPKLGQSASSVSSFGKETLLEEIQKDVFINFVKVVYVQWTAWKDESRVQLKNFKQAGTAKIIEFKRGFFETKLHAANAINEVLENDMRTLATRIFEKIKDGMKDAQSLYYRFCGAFFARERAKETEALDSVFDKLFLQIDQAVRFGTKKFTLQQELAKDLDNAVGAIDEKILEIYSQAEKLFWELERNKL